ncbi:MAG TPA: hypothetical protein VFB23_15720 [Candidatus Acidoferrales bacterium]|jgi:predicted dinucleotide-binding enzyme|nr:hypothetical protein [Candidatus Acidoferrales bacterium]
MKIAMYGKGNVGGGLADLWEHKGHQVTRLGQHLPEIAKLDLSC